MRWHILRTYVCMYICTYIHVHTVSTQVQYIWYVCTYKLTKKDDKGFVLALIIF